MNHENEGKNVVSYGSTDKDSLFAASTWDHIIPMVYLKAWRDKGAGFPAKVWLLDKGGLRGELLPCKRALVETDFYWAIDEHGRPSKSPERFLGLAESRFGFSRKQVELARPLGTTDQRKLLEFSMGLFARTLSWRHYLSVLGAACEEIAVKDATARPEQFLGRNVGRMERRFLRRKVEDTVKGLRAKLKLSVEQMVATGHTALIKVAVETISNSQASACYLRSEQGSFLASDAPCFLEERGVLDVPCEQRPGYLWFMPMSPNVVLVAGLGVQNGYFEADQEWAGRFNYRLRQNAYRWLVSQEESIADDRFANIPEVPPCMRETAEQSLFRAIQELRKERGQA